MVCFQHYISEESTLMRLGRIQPPSDGCAFFGTLRLVPVGSSDENWLIYCIYGWLYNHKLGTAKDYSGFQPKRQRAANRIQPIEYINESEKEEKKPIFPVKKCRLSKNRNSGSDGAGGPGSGRLNESNSRSAILTECDSAHCLAPDSGLCNKMSRNIRVLKWWAKPTLPVFAGLYEPCSTARKLPAAIAASTLRRCDTSSEP